MIDSKAYEAEIIPGIEMIAIDELKFAADGDISDIQLIRPGFVRFAFDGNRTWMRNLRSVVAIYSVHQFDVPRPKALLGHQHFTRLLGIFRRVLADFSHGSPSLGIGAAGAGSAVIRRLKNELAEALGIPANEDDKGELYFRLARSRESDGWDVLARLTEQPLSKRCWRAVDVPGALNATVAYAMTRLGSPREGERILNLCSGTATFLIEHALSMRSAKLLGLDYNDDMLAAARLNLSSSGTSDRIHQIQADVTHIPLPNDSVDRIFGDLPFGNHIGSHEENLRSYPRLFRDAARVARENAAFVLLTHEISLMHSLLPESDWIVESQLKINLAGLHPRIFVLKRKSNRI